MLAWLEHYEALWLFILIGGELIVGLYSAWMLHKEFVYDKAWNEEMLERRKERRRKKYEFEQLNTGEGK
jgi:hypothetical protein